MSHETNQDDDLPAAHLDAARDNNPGRGPLGRYLVADAELADSPAARAARLHQEFGGDLALAVCHEIIDFLGAEGWLVQQQSPAPKDGPEWKAAFIKMLEYGWKHHRTPQMFALLYIWDLPLLDDVYGHLTQKEFADTLPGKGADPLTKAAVNNAVKDAQKFFGRPPRQDQRPESACTAMKKTRLTNLAAGQAKSC